MIYIISDGKNFKIGKSKHPKKRLKQLQTGHPTTLKIIAQYDCPDYMEKRLHKAFFYFGKKGEWFFVENQARFLSICAQICQV